MLSCAAAAADGTVSKRSVDGPLKFEVSAVEVLLAALLSIERRDSFDAGEPAAWKRLNERPNRRSIQTRGNHHG